LYASLNIIRVITLRRMRWWNMQHAQERWEISIKFRWENLTGRYSSEDIDVDERIILEWILKEIGCEGVDWIHLAQDREEWRAVVNAVKKKNSGFIKAGEYLNCLNHYYRLKQKSAEVYKVTCIYPEIPRYILQPSLSIQFISFILIAHTLRTIHGHEKTW
jgi:hypothetical protein